MKNVLLMFSVVMAFWACNQKTQETEETSNNKEAAAGEAVSENDGASPKGVSFVVPAEGSTVSSPVKVEMAVSGMEVEPAGELKDGKGHHHIIIDGSFIPTGTVVPADSTNIHYGKGQTETTLDLAPGEHTLTLQFADGLHQSYGEEWSKTISITVE